MVSTFSGKNQYIIGKAVQEKARRVNVLNLSILEQPIVGELTNFINVPPIEGTKRIVIVKSLKSLHEKQTIASIKNKLSTTYLIFQLIDFSSKSNLKGWLQQHGSFEVIKVFDDRAAKRYLKQRLTELKFTMETKNEDALDYFLHIVGTEPAAIDSELNNLVGLEDIVITNIIIQENVTRRTPFPINSVLDSIFFDDYKTSVTFVQQFLSEKKSNVNTLFNILLWNLKIGIMIKGGANVYELPLNPYSIRKVSEHVRHFSLEQVVCLFRELSCIIGQMYRGVAPTPAFFLALYTFKS